MLELLNKYKKQIGYIIIGLWLVYGTVWLSTRQPKMPADIKATIDSLTDVNKQLLEKQKQIDSTIKVYETEISQIDSKVDNIKKRQLLFVNIITK